METPNQFRRSKLQFKLARFFASQALVSFLKALAKLLRVSNLKSAISTLVRMITGSIGQMIRESKRIGQTTTDQFNKIPWGHVFAYALVVTIMALTAFNVYLFREQMPWSTMGAILLRVASIAPFVAASILLALAIYLIIKYSVLATKFVLTKSVTYLWRLVKMLVSVLVRVFHFEFNKRNADEGWEVSILSISVLSKTKNSISILSISLGTLSYLAIGLAGASILTSSLFSTGDGAQDPFPKDSLPESESIDEVLPPLLPAEIDEALGSDATPSPSGWRLFDLENDPGEKKNLIKEEPEIAERLREEFLRWFDEVTRGMEYTPIRIPVGHPDESPVEIEPSWATWEGDHINYTFDGYDWDTIDGWRN